MPEADTSSAGGASHRIGYETKELWMSVVRGLTTPGIGFVDPPGLGISTEPTYVVHEMLTQGAKCFRLFEA
jgi:hypothetical protein